MLAQPGLEEVVGQVVSSNNAHNLEEGGGEREKKKKQVNLSSVKAKKTAEGPEGLAFSESGWGRLSSMQEADSIAFWFHPVPP